MLKKIVSLVVGATLVLATLGVAAAEVATTTTYDRANGTIAVETAVTSANPGEVYTYLAYKLGENGSLANLQNNEVVYVDEKEILAGESGTTFAYTTAIANDQAVVLVGDPASDNTFDGVIEEGRQYINYTVAVGAGEAVAGNIDVTDLNAEIAVVEIPAEIGSAIVTDVKVDGASVDFIATNAGVKIPLASLVEGSAIVVEVSEGAIQTAVTILDGSYIPAENAAEEDELPYSSVLALAQIEGTASEYGIWFGPQKNEINVFKAPALGQGSDGKYAIRIYGFDQMQEGYKIDNGVAVWAQAYAVVNGEEIKSEQVCRIGLDEVAAE